MDTKLINKLNSLIHLDIDATHAYTQALDNIDVADIHEQLVRFREDHERHIADLSALVREFGGEPPAHKRDLKGFFIESFTAIRSKTGTEGALKAMKGNEELTNKTYAKALEETLPANVKAVVERNYSDEKRHLSYIKNALSEKRWEEPIQKVG